MDERQRPMDWSCAVTSWDTLPDYIMDELRLAIGRLLENIELLPADDISDALEMLQNIVASLEEL